MSESRKSRAPKRDRPCQWQDQTFVTSQETTHAGGVPLCFVSGYFPTNPPKGCIFRNKPNYFLVFHDLHIFHKISNIFENSGLHLRLISTNKNSRVNFSQKNLKFFIISHIVVEIISLLAAPKSSLRASLFRLLLAVHKPKSCKHTQSILNIKKIPNKFFIAFFHQAILLATFLLHANSAVKELNAIMPLWVPRT